MKYLTDIDMNHNKISNLVLENSSGSPSTLGRKAGEILYDSSDNSIKVFNGTEWNSTNDDLIIQKLETAEDGYSASYQLSKNGVNIGDKINIPRDLVVESGSVKECTVADTPVEGYVIGDKYIDLILANSDEQHVYVLVTDLVDKSLELGETSDTAYQGDRGKIAYEHSQTTGNPHNLELSDLNITVTNEEINQLDGVTDNIQIQLDEKLTRDIDGDIYIHAYVLNFDDTVDEPSSGYIKFRLGVLRNGEVIATPRYATIGFSSTGSGSLGTSLSDDYFDYAYIHNIQCKYVVANTKVTTPSLVVQNDITAVTCDFTDVTIDNTLSLQLTDKSDYINVAEQLENILNTDIIANKTLPNFYDSRPTSADITPTGSGGLMTFKATSTMTESKPETGDGHIIHLYWDNTGGYDSQIFVKGGVTSCIQFRSSSKGVWTNWYTALDSSNYTNYTYSKDDIKTAINTLASRLAKLDGGASSLL